MKRKRKVTNARNTSESSAMSSGPASSQPNLKNQEPAENCVKEEDFSIDHDRKLEAPKQNMEETEDHQPGPPCQGPIDGQLNATSPPNLQLTAVLPACHQGAHHDVNAADNILLLETSATDITGQVSDGITGNLCPLITGNLCPLPIVTDESNGDERCPNETDMPAASITETKDISGQVNGAHQTSETSDCSITVIEGMKGDVCESGDACEMPLINTCVDRNVSAIQGDPNSDIQASQKCPPQTSDLPNTPNLPEITSQVQCADSQPDLKIEDVSLPDRDPKLQERDAECPQDPGSQPEETWALMTDQSLLRGANIIQSQQSGSLRGMSSGLDLPDSQLLGALEESPCQSGKIAENHISDHLPPASHRPEIPQATTSPPPGNAAQDTGRPQQRRTEDASPIVQGLIMEMSNINRLIMSSYRELRQMRVRHTPGRGAANGRRRREM